MTTQNNAMLYIRSVLILGHENPTFICNSYRSRCCVSGPCAENRNHARRTALHSGADLPNEVSLGGRA